MKDFTKKYLEEIGFETNKTLVVDGTNINLPAILEEYQERSDNYKNKYLRLLADFENYKKRIGKEKNEIKNKTKIELLDSILDMNDDISLAVNNITDDTTLKNVKLIEKKLSDFLKSMNIEEIQTKKYDSDKHDVVYMVENTEKESGVIVDVIKKGYMLNGDVFRYPKVSLNK